MSKPIKMQSVPVFILRGHHWSRIRPGGARRPVLRWARSDSRGQSAAAASPRRRARPTVGGRGLENRC
uniref:Uncharacterized protein n=2 Tax=Pyricularia oryzae TaxID=318829 RepID=L7J7N4_PYRO1